MCSPSATAHSPTGRAGQSPHSLPVIPRLHLNLLYKATQASSGASRFQVPPFSALSALAAQSAAPPSLLGLCCQHPHLTAEYFPGHPIINDAHSGLGVPCPCAHPSGSLHTGLNRSLWPGSPMRDRMRVHFVHGSVFNPETPQVQSQHLIRLGRW